MVKYCLRVGALTLTFEGKTKQKSHKNECFHSKPPSSVWRTGTGLRAERPKVTMRDGQGLYGKELWEHTGNEGRKCRKERKYINKKT